MKEKHPAASGPTGAIQVSPWRAGLWRWTFRDAGGGLTLPSNRAYESREAAEEAARVAYPDVPIEAVPGMTGSRVGVGVMGLTVAGLGVAAAVGVGAAVGLAVLGGKAAVLLGKRTIRKRRQ